MAVSGGGSPGITNVVDLLSILPGGDTRVGFADDVGFVKGSSATRSPWAPAGNARAVGAICVNS